MVVQSMGSIQILTVWIQTPAQPLSCPALGKCLYIPEPQFPHLYSREDNDLLLMELGSGTNEVLQVAPT